MKSLYMHTIIGSSERDNFMTLTLGFLKVIYSDWVSMTALNLHNGRRANPV